MGIDNETKLLPCPFCGGKAELIIVPGYFKQGPSSSGWLVKCLAGCCNQMPYTSDHDAIDAWNRRAEETPPQGWISVEDSLPPEHDTIFAKLYGTDKWRNAMFRKMSDDVRVVKIFNDGTKRVHHDYTVDGVWESERKGTAVYGHVTHWMQNPELPKVIESCCQRNYCPNCGAKMDAEDV